MSILDTEGEGEITVNLQQLKYALEVYRQNSFRKAAQSLFVTQPTLSIAIKELEKELGFAIFERGAHGISPTLAGTAFITAISDVFTRLEQIRAQYSESAEAPLVLRISTSRYSFVATCLLQYYREQLLPIGRYSVTVEEQDCQQTILDVLHRKSEIGIIHINSRNHSAQLKFFQEKHIHYGLLFQKAPCLVFRAGHPLEKKKTISEEDMAKFPQIRTSSRNMTHYNVEANFNFTDYINNGKNFFLNSRAMIYNILPNCDAVFLALCADGIHPFYPNLVVRPLQDETPNYFYYITLEDVPPSKYSKRFIEILKNETAAFASVGEEVRRGPGKAK